MSKQADYSRRKTNETADIGTLPKIVDPARRERCKTDLHEFLTTYFPLSTGLSPFGDAHREAIHRLQVAILDGGLFINVFPRGYGKTTIAENAAIWAILYGHRKFVPIFGADANSACGNIDSIKTELADNDLLYEDFPEACHAIRALEGKPQRCASQTFVPGNVEGFDPIEGAKAELTRISWTADMIVLPTIMLPDGYSACSGSAITTRGIESGARGMKYKRHDGTQQRPDFVMIDDPQTDGSAASASQITKRLNVIQKSILRLGGHGKRLAVVVNATVIQPDDLIETMMDAKRFPAWQSQRIAMVKSFPAAHETLWLDKYATLRNTYDPDTVGDQQRAHRDATQFYKDNREAMDAGASVAWDECYDRENEASAIQHAYNILIDDGEEVFASECQNQPKSKENAEARQLSAKEIAKRVNGVPRGVVPSSCDKLTAFIDVQGEAVYFVVMGWDSATFSGHVVDFGTWPEQPTAYYELKTLPKKLSKVFPGLEQNALTHAALTALLDGTDEKPGIAARVWRREDGVEMTIARGLIDYGWDQSAEAVFSVCRKRRGIWFPSKGKGVGAKQSPFDLWKRREGETHGKGWKVSPSGGHLVALYETNHWKSFARDAWMAPLGSKTTFQLFGKDPAALRMFCDQAAAERYERITAESQGRTVDEWSLPSHRPDNHLGDGVVGCAVAANMVGVRTPVQNANKPGPRRIVSFAEAKAGRTVHKVNRSVA